MNFKEIYLTNHAKLKFVTFFAIAVLLCVVILSSFWTANPATARPELKESKTMEAPGAEQLLMVSQLLQNRWMQLEGLYDQHALHLADPSINNNVANEQIMEAEVSYAKVLDSVSATNSTSAVVERIDSIVNSFRANLQNKQALNSNIGDMVLRNSKNAGGSVGEASNVQIQQLQELKTELVAKNDLVARLQSELTAGAGARSDAAVTGQKLQQLQTDLKSKSDMIAKLQGELTSTAAIKTSLNNNELKLQKAQDELKSGNQLIASLQNQLKATASKSTNGLASEQKVRQLQTEVQTKSEMIVKLQGEMAKAAAIKTSLTSNELKLQKAQDDLKSGNQMIASLQSQLRATASRSTNGTASEQKLRQLQTDLQTKSEMIVKLQIQLKASPGVTAVPDNKKLAELQKELQGKTAMIAKLQSQVKGLPAKSTAAAAPGSPDLKKMQDELEFLKWALRSEVSSNHTLTNNVNQLKQQNATLSNQLKSK